MNDDEIYMLCKRITTWDQAELDRLVGRPAVEYAKAHERDVRRLAREMWAVFPLGPRWWRINHALKNVFAKNNAIRARAAQIGKDRESGRIVEHFGRLVYADQFDHPTLTGAPSPCP
jgi:hypothetical protein